MNNSTAQILYDYKNPINAAAACSMFLVGSFGLISNSLMVYVFFREKSERTSFNLICLFRSSANIYILLTTFFADFIPATLIGYSLYDPEVETWMIGITNSIYVVNEYITIIVAVNRFTALFFPVFYTKLFGFKTTLLYLILVYIFRGGLLIQELVQYPQGCYYLYFIDILAWSTSEDEKCQQSQDFFLMFTLCSLLGISILNLCTFLRIIMFYKNGHGNQDLTSRRKIKSNIKLFFQTLLQDSLFLIDLTSTYKLNGLSKNRIWTFICGSQIWQCLHSFDGFIMIMFNERFSLIKNSLFSSPSVSKISPVGRVSHITKTILPTVQ